MAAWPAARPPGHLPAPLASTPGCLAAPGPTCLTISESLLERKKVLRFNVESLKTNAGCCFNLETKTPYSLRRNAYIYFNVEITIRNLLQAATPRRLIVSEPLPSRICNDSKKSGGEDSQQRSTSTHGRRRRTRRRSGQQTISQVPIGCVLYLTFLCCSRSRFATLSFDCLSKQRDGPERHIAIRRGGAGGGRKRRRRPKSKRRDSRNSEFESNSCFNVEGGFLSAPYALSVQRFQNCESIFLVEEFGTDLGRTVGRGFANTVHFWRTLGRNDHHKIHTVPLTVLPPELPRLTPRMPCVRQRRIRLSQSKSSPTGFSKRQM